VIENDLQVLGALSARLVRQHPRLVGHEAHGLDDPAALAVDRVVVVVDQAHQHGDIGGRTPGAQLQLTQLGFERRMQLRAAVRRWRRVRPNERRRLPGRRLLALGDRPHGSGF